VPLLALSLFRCSLFGRASPVFSERFFKRMRPKKKAAKIATNFETKFNKCKRFSIFDFENGHK